MFYLKYAHSIPTIPWFTPVHFLLINMLTSTNSSAKNGDAPLTMTVCLDRIGKCTPVIVTLNGLFLTEHGNMFKSNHLMCNFISPCLAWF